MLPKKLKIELLHDPAITFLGICSKQIKSGSQRDIALSRFLSQDKQPECPHRDRNRGNAVCRHIQTVGYHSIMRKEEILTCATIADGTWKHCDKWSRLEKYDYYLIPLVMWKFKRLNPKKQKVEW